jgi:hypothetical protein
MFGLFFEISLDILHSKFSSTKLFNISSIGLDAKNSHYVYPPYHGITLVYTPNSKKVVLCTPLV